MTRNMKDSGIEWIGQIPEDWEVVRNKYMFLRKKELVGQKWNETQLLSLTTKGIINKDINNLEGKLPESFSTYQYIQKNDLVLCLFDLDMSAVFNGLSKYNGMISPAYKRYVLKTDGDIRYYNYLFDFAFYDRIYKNYSTTLRFTLDNQEFDRIPTIEPSTEVQKRLSDFLDNKIEMIEKTKNIINKEIQTLEDYKKSVITEAVTKGLDKNVEMKNSRIEWIGEIPKHWEIKRLKYVMNNLNYQRVPVDASKRNNNSDILYDYYGATGVIDKIDGYTTVGRNILIGEDGANLVFRNLPLIYIADGKYWVNNHAHILHPKDGNLNYFAYQMEVIDYRNFITGAAQPKLNLENLKKVALVYPPKKEQNEIADYLDKKTATIDETISAKKKQLEIIEEYKKSLIYEYVTGKKEVEDVGTI